MSASISCSERAREMLARVRRGDIPHAIDIKLLGEQCPRDFFRIIVESLADSFDPFEASIYDELMSVWTPAASRVDPEIPQRVQTVYVLSRVTLGADIKIVSPILMAMRQRFPDARVVFVANHKSIKLFEDERGLDFLEAEYPRGGSIRDRTLFAEDLRKQLNTPNRIVVDPDSRMTQLGLIPVCESEHYFHFPSRTAGGYGNTNLTELVRAWLDSEFGITGPAFIAPKRVEFDATRPIASISLGVGENENKRLGIEFERRMIAEIAKRFRTVFLDRGAGGSEAARVTEAAESSGFIGRIRFHGGSFAAFASLISQSDFYVGYDSAGQHAAAAAGVPLATIFAGAPSARFRERWAPASENAHIIDGDALSQDEALAALLTFLPGLL